MRHFSLFLPLLCTFTVTNISANTFTEFKKQQLLEATSFSKQYKQDYANFREAYLADYDSFRDSLLKHWSVPIQSSTLKQVVYSADLKSRIIIDEQSMTVTVETLDSHSTLGQAAETLITDKNLASSLELISPTKQELENSLAISKSEIKSQKELKQNQETLAQEITTQYEQSLSSVDKNTQLKPQQAIQSKQQLAIEKQQRIEKLNTSLSTKDNDVTYKNITSRTFSLPDEYLHKKVSPYLNFYLQYEQQQLPLLLAISHAESSFNPNAKSHIPAFGLMQIVPNSAGLDVARKHFKKDIAPTPEELFDPDTNITYGSAYISILDKSYLRKIKDPISRKYCAIAAYNTGAGNVAKAFNTDKSRNINRAISIINNLDNESVYSHLIANLPYDETKKYLKKVNKLEQQYQANINQWNLNNKEIKHEK